MKKLDNYDDDSRFEHSVTYKTLHLYHMSQQGRGFIFPDDNNSYCGVIGGHSHTSLLNTRRPKILNITRF